MIDRYSRPEMRAIILAFHEETRWLAFSGVLLGALRHVDAIFERALRGGSS